MLKNVRACELRNAVATLAFTFCFISLKDYITIIDFNIYVFFALFQKRLVFAKLRKYGVFKYNGERYCRTINALIRGCMSADEIFTTHEYSCLHCNASRSIICIQGW